MEGTLIVRIGKGQMKKLQKKARNELRSLSEIVREFIDLGLKREECKRSSK